MNTRLGGLAAVIGLAFLAGLGWNVRAALASEAPPARILVVAGPCDHPPGTHEAAAGARLLKFCLENASNLPAVSVQIAYDWPTDRVALDGLASIVFIGDRFPPERMQNSAHVKEQLSALMQGGCGIVCVHYATGLQAQHVAEDGDHPLLHWIGGYFATGCEHHRSVARVCTATLTPAEGNHPVLRGWKAFTIDDEPYWNNYFGKTGPGPNVTSIATAMLPADAPKKEIVAWAVDRADGGRGVGAVVPHFFQNWQVDDLRMMILNAICWTAKLEIPAVGVKTTLPADLTVFQPESVEPRPRPNRQ